MREKIKNFFVFVVRKRVLAIVLVLVLAVSAIGYLAYQKIYADETTALACNPATDYFVDALELLPEPVYQYINGDKSPEVAKEAKAIINGEPLAGTRATKINEITNKRADAAIAKAVERSNNALPEQFKNPLFQGEASDRNSDAEQAPLDMDYKLDFSSYADAIKSQKMRLDWNKLSAITTESEVSARGSARRDALTLEWDDASFLKAGMSSEGLDKFKKLAEETQKILLKVAGPPVNVPPNRRVKIVADKPLIVNSAGGQYRPYMYLPVCIFGKCTWLKLLDGIADDRIVINPDLISGGDSDSKIAINRDPDEIPSGYAKTFIHELAHAWRGSRTLGVTSQFEEGLAEFEADLVLRTIAESWDRYSAILSQKPDPERLVSEEGSRLIKSETFNGPLSRAHADGLYIGKKYDLGAEAIAKLYITNPELLKNLHEKLGRLTHAEYWNNYFGHFALKWNKWRPDKIDTRQSNDYAKKVVLEAVGANNRIDGEPASSYVYDLPLFSRNATEGNFASYYDDYGYYLYRKNKDGVAKKVNSSDEIIGQTVFDNGKGGNWNGSLQLRLPGIGEIGVARGLNPEEYPFTNRKEVLVKYLNGKVNFSADGQEFSTGKFARFVSYSNITVYKPDEDRIISNGLHERSIVTTDIYNVPGISIVDTTGEMYKSHMYCKKSGEDKAQYIGSVRFNAKGTGPHPTAEEIYPVGGIDNLRGCYGAATVEVVTKTGEVYQKTITTDGDYQFVFDKNWWKVDHWGLRMNNGWVPLEGKVQVDNSTDLKAVLWLPTDLVLEAGVSKEVPYHLYTYKNCKSKSCRAQSSTNGTASFKMDRGNGAKLLSGSNNISIKYTSDKMVEFDNLRFPAGGGRPIAVSGKLLLEDIQTEGTQLNISEWRISKKNDAPLESADNKSVNITPEDKISFSYEVKGETSKCKIIQYRDKTSPGEWEIDDVPDSGNNVFKGETWISGMQSSLDFALSCLDDKSGAWIEAPYRLRANVE